MVVYNESAVIERALSSIKPFISYWVIVDTGSWDDTKNRIRDCLKNIPGELHERCAEGKEHNRNVALDLARGKADYILFLDAHDWLQYEPTFAFPNLTADVYWTKWQSTNTMSCSCMKPLMIKDGFTCQWEGAAYEYITCNGSAESLEGIRGICEGSGEWEENRVALEQALEKNPNNARNVFYLAENYREANCLEKALAAYQKRVAMGGWSEEVFWSLLQMGHLKKKLGYRYEEIFVCYLQAHHVNIFRSEPIYYIAELNNEKRYYNVAYEFLKHWYRIPKLGKSNGLFRMEWIDEYGLAFQHSITAFYMNQYQESLDLHDKLLRLVSIPPIVRKQVLLNREFPIDVIKRNSP